MRRRDPLPRTALLAAVLAGLAPAAGCIHIADQQSARLLEPGQYEVTPSFSRTSFSWEGESEHIADQYGLRVAYGASETVEVRAAYERLDEADGGEALNLFGIGAKFSLVEDAVAFFLPVGFVFGEDVESGDTWTAAPTLLATWRASPGFELTPSAKAIYPFAAEDPELFLGFNLGAGISTDLDRWAVRPEVGATINPGDDGTLWGLTLGFSFRP